MQVVGWLVPSLQLPCPPHCRLQDCQPMLCASHQQQVVVVTWAHLEQRQLLIVLLSWPVLG
jgi:hypothetical protein